MADREYIVGERRRREISRALALYEKDLQKTRDSLEVRELTEGKKEVNGRLADVAALRRQFGIQGDALDGDSSVPLTPIEEAIETAEGAAPGVPTPPEEGATVAWPDGTASTITSILGYDDNREAFEVVDSRGDARHVFFEAGEWRVLALVLEYPPSLPPTKGEPVVDFDGPTDGAAAPAPGRTGRKGARRGGEPTPVGETAAQVARKAGANVARASGDRKVPVGKGKRLGQRGMIKDK